MKKHFCVFFTVLIILVGCSSIENSESSNDEVRVIGIDYDYSLSNNYESLLEKSELIVSGNYNELNSKWNMARNPDDIELDDEEYYTEGLIYNFSIDEILYSSNVIDETSILVNLRHFERIDVPHDDGSVESINYTDPFFIEPVSDQKYVLFLQYNHNFDHYYAASEPFQFSLENEELVVISNLFKEDKTNVQKTSKTTVNGPTFENITDEFSGIKVKELEELITKVKE